MNNQLHLNKKADLDAKLPTLQGTYVLANTRLHIITQFILYFTQVGIFSKIQWEVVDSVLYTAGGCKMMVPAHTMVLVSLEFTKTSGYIYDIATLSCSLVFRHRFICAESFKTMVPAHSACQSGIYSLQ